MKGEQRDPRWPRLIAGAPTVRDAAQTDWRSFSVIEASHSLGSEVPNRRFRGTRKAWTLFFHGLR
ncbi:hypothetical protein FFM54_05275 [Burkholderia pseudomallei]|nr:hypothetical protein FFM54_05275 [Burkholderia pseudomallei]